MQFYKIAFPLFVFNFVLNNCAPVFNYNNLDKWTRELHKLTKNDHQNVKDINTLTNRKNCGGSLQHLAGLVLDKSDKDARLIVEGSIFFNKLTLKLGNIKEKEIDIKTVILPIETLSNKCINIRHAKHGEESTILCLSTKVLRNFWINSITDAVLCKLTNIKGKLPEFDYFEEDAKKNEDQEEDQTSDEDNDEEQRKITEDKINARINNEEFEDVKEEEKKGVQLRIGNSKFGQADIKINGKPIHEIIENKENGEIEKNSSEKSENESVQIDNNDDETIES